METISLTLPRRKHGQKEDLERPPQQLYRPNGSMREAQALLEQENLTEQEILDFCCSSWSSTSSSTTNSTRCKSSDEAATSTSSEDERDYEERTQQFRRRRIEIQDLLRKVRTGHARLDQDGRLIPVSETERNNNRQPAAPPNIDLPPPPPPPPPPPRRNNVNNPNNNNNNNMDLLGAAAVLMNEDENEQRHHRQWLRQEQREAAAAIERAVERYRNQGVNDDDLLLVRIEPAAADQRQRTNRTFRRICFAILAVTTSVICIMLQHLPSYDVLFSKKSSSSSSSSRSKRDKSSPADSSGYVLDKLTTELLHVKTLEHHAQHCPGLHRENLLLLTSSSSSSSSWIEQLWGQVLLHLGRGRGEGVVSNNTQDCSDGVLHIPPQAFLTSNRGINASWFMPCHAPPDISTNDLPASYPGSPASLIAMSSNSTCPDPSSVPTSTTLKPFSSCFRGVHDEFASHLEVDQALRLGAQLIRNGGDHFDIHYSVHYLQESIPSIVTKLHTLLTDTYNVHGPIAPVAYRVSAAGPLDGRGVPRVLKSDYASTWFGRPSFAQQMVAILNMTNYVNYIEHAQHRNDLARYSLPWPFQIAPERDHCMLMADLQANEQFAIHTTIFLSSGGSSNYAGGASLYVDHDKSNFNPRRKIRRGLSVDGSKGRVVVSTGGMENRRCRLPVRAGVRAALQIWWS